MLLSVLDIVSSDNAFADIDKAVPPPSRTISIVTVLQRRCRISACHQEKRKCTAEQIPRFLPKQGFGGFEPVVVSLLPFVLLNFFYVCAPSIVQVLWLRW